MTKINIGSVQINNGFSGQFYLPYSIGLLQAFLLHNSKDSSRFNFQTTIYKRWLLSDCVEKLKKPGFETKNPRHKINKPRIRPNN